MLRQLKVEDTEGIMEWMEDPSINCYYRFDAKSITYEKVIDFIENSFTDKCRHYAIVDINDEYLGTISLKDIDLINKNAEYAIALRKKAIGSGIAKSATVEILQIAFVNLNLNKVFLNVLSDNHRAIHFYEKMGFEFEGEFLEHIFLKGEYRNIKWYSIRRNQYVTVD